MHDLINFDREHVWHPYSCMDSPNPVYPVVSAQGVRLKLADGHELIDGMSSWWSVIHGYNHPKINQALKDQIDQMSHVMFGGLTHAPAVNLAKKLIQLTPASLEKVFFADSGSVSVEVALKMALQYWQAKGQMTRTRFLTLRGGYHGDTFGAMSVCDPVTGMHSLFNDVLPKHIFVERPKCRFGDTCRDEDLTNFKNSLIGNKDDIAAVIIEPIVQGAGGMWFYSAEYLHKVRELCSEHNVLLILDEIATGFGRTGKLFALEHADITPDILCLGKALTGGYMTLAATLTTRDISTTISLGDPGVFMHGPTFMANPLACAAANASIELLLESDWQSEVQRIERGLRAGLEACRSFANVKDVRVLGAIGVVELDTPVDMQDITQQFVNAGVWIRPFGKLVYLMPPYIISDEDLKQLTTAIVSSLAN